MNQQQASKFGDVIIFMAIGGVLALTAFAFTPNTEQASAADQELAGVERDTARLIEEAGAAASDVKWEDAGDRVVAENIYKADEPVRVRTDVRRPQVFLNDGEQFIADYRLGTEKNHLEQLFYAIRLQETPDSNDPFNQLGDGGDSLGPYQIQRAYLQDAVEQDRGLKSVSYDDVRRPIVAELVMLAYWERYAPKDYFAVVKGHEGWREAAVRLARIHNGGPTGHRKSATAGYGERVRQILTAN